MRDQSARPVVALLAAALASVPHVSVAATCAQTVSKASAKFLQTTAKAVQRCHDMRLKGQLPANTDCSAESGTVMKINAYRTRLSAQIRGACGTR
jgi:hypothetical protein